MDSQTGSDDARTRVFLSYSRKDAALVARVADGLMAAGFLADYDQAAHDPQNVSAGISAEDEWWKRLQEMIASADVMVFLVSPDSAASAVCDEEIAYARALGKRIIAVLARPVDFAKAPPRLSALNVRIDFSETGPGFDAALAGLVSALAMNVGWHREGRKYYARVQEWDTAGRPKSRLLREGAVEEAERWALARPRNEPEPGELFLAWVAASRAQIKRDAAVRAFWRRVTAVFVLTTLIATLAGAWFVVNGQRNLGRSESLMLARTSDQFYNSGDYTRALHLAILASRESFLAPSTDEAKAAFAKSAQALRLKGVLQVDDALEIQNVVVVADGQRLLVTMTNGAAELWDIAGKARVAGPFLPDGSGGVPFLMLADGGRRALLQWSNALIGLDTVTGATFGPIQGDGTYGATMGIEAYPQDGSRFLAHDSETGLGLRDGATGERIAGISSGPNWAQRAAVTADGKRALVGNETEIGMWDMTTGARAGPVLLHGEDGVMDIIISPDGSRAIASYHKTGSVYYAIEDGVLSEIGRIIDGALYGAQFFPEAGRLITSSEQSKLQIRDLRNGAEIGEPVSDDSVTGGPEVSLRYGLVLVRSYQMGIRVLSLATGEQLAVLDDTAYTSAMFAPDKPGFYAWHGRSVIFQPVDGSGDGAQDIVTEHPGFIEDIALSADGTQLITYSGDGGARVWNTRNGLEEGGVYPHTNYNVRQGFVGTDNTFMTVLAKQIFIWQAGAFARAGPPPVLDGDPLSNSILSPDGRFLLAWTEAGRGILWDVANGRTVGPGILTGEQGSWGAVFAPGGERLALWFENSIQIIETATGVGKEVLFESGDVVINGQFTDDGTRLVSTDAAGSVRIWDIAAMATVGEALAHEGYGPLTIDAGRGRLIVFQGAMALLVDLKTGQQIGEPLEHVFYGGNEEGILVHSAVFSGNGRVVASSNAAELRVWNAETGAQIGEAMREGTGGGAVLSVDGQRILLLNGLGAAVRDTSTGALVGTPFAEGLEVYGGSLSADAKIAATWGDDTMLRLWDVETGKIIGNPYMTGLIEHDGQFTDDGRRLLLSEPTGTFRIIDTATGEVVSVMTQPDFEGGAVWKPEEGTLLTHAYSGEVRLWDISDALRVDATAKDVAAACAGKLDGTRDASGVPFVQRLDGTATFAAPILRGREGEDVCAPARVPWWETAAGAVFGWAFR